MTQLILPPELPKLEARPDKTVRTGSGLIVPAILLGEQKAREEQQSRVASAQAQAAEAQQRLARGLPPSGLNHSQRRQMKREADRQARQSRRRLNRAAQRLERAKRGFA